MKFFILSYRPTDVDALFLGHALFVLHALPVFIFFLMKLQFMFYFLLKTYEITI